MPTLPNTVVSLGEGVLESCKELMAIMIGNSIASIGFGIFSECPKLAIVTTNRGKIRQEKMQTTNAYGNLDATKYVLLMGYQHYLLLC